MSLSVVAFGFGAILILVAVLGRKGGITIQNLQLPPVGAVGRSVSAVVGLLSVLLGVALNSGPLANSANSLHGSANTTSPTPTPSLSTTSSPSPTPSLSTTTSPTPTPSLSTTTSPSPTASSGPAPRFPSQLETELLIHVPKDFRATCTRDSGLNGESAGLLCYPAFSVAEVWYGIYDSYQSLTQAFFSYVNGHNIPHGQGLCSGDQFFSETTYTQNKVTMGDVACYTSDGKSWMLWTYDKLDILVFAVRNDLDYKALYNWWTNTDYNFLNPGIS